MPSMFCLDIFFKYEMHDEALYFLYYRKEYKDLMFLIGREFEKSIGDKTR